MCSEGAWTQGVWKSAQSRWKEAPVFVCFLHHSSIASRDDSEAPLGLEAAVLEGADVPKGLVCTKCGREVIGPNFGTISYNLLQHCKNGQTSMVQKNIYDMRIT